MAGPISILLVTFLGHPEDLHRLYDALRVKWVVNSVSGDQGGRLEDQRDSRRTPEGSRRVMDDVPRADSVGQGGRQLDPRGARRKFWAPESQEGGY